MIGYASSGNGTDFKFILTLDILEIGTDFKRSVFDKNYAKYSCHSAAIKSIENKESGEFVDKIQHDIYPELFHYVGEVINGNINFYLTRDAAYHYRYCFLANGVDMEFHNDGQLGSRTYYRNGKMHGTMEEWYPNGQKKSFGCFEDDKCSGLHTGWHANGQKQFEWSFQNGKMNGIAMRWHDNGTILSKNYFRNGKQHGLYQEWNKNGIHVKDKEFQNGILLEKV